LRIINSKFFEKRQNSLKIIKQQQIRWKSSTSDPLRIINKNFFENH
jgi:hypothetical protein